MLEIIRAASAISSFRISSCRSALQNFRTQAAFSLTANSDLRQGLILFHLNEFRAFSTHCRELSDSSYSNNSAVEFRAKHLLSVGWTKLTHNFVVNRISAAADLKSHSASCKLSLYAFSFGLQIQKQAIESKLLGVKLIIKKRRNY